MVAADLENDVRYLPWQEIVRTWQLKIRSGGAADRHGETLGVWPVYSGRPMLFDEK